MIRIEAPKAKLEKLASVLCVSVDDGCIRLPRYRLDEAREAMMNINQIKPQEIKEEAA